MRFPASFAFSFVVPSGVRSGAFSVVLAGGVADGAVGCVSVAHSHRQSASSWSGLAIGIVVDDVNVVDHGAPRDDGDSIASTKANAGSFAAIVDGEDPGHGGKGIIDDASEVPGVATTGDDGAFAIGSGGGGEGGSDEVPDRAAVVPFGLGRDPFVEPDALVARDRFRRRDGPPPGGSASGSSGDEPVNPGARAGSRVGTWVARVATEGGIRRGGHVLLPFGRVLRWSSCRSFAPRSSRASSSGSDARNASGS